MNLEKKDFDFAGKFDDGVEGQDTGGDIGKNLGVGDQAVGQDGERDVHVLCPAGRYIAGQKWRFADELASVVEEGGGVGVLKAHLVRVVNGDIRSESDVHVHFQPGKIQRHVQILDAQVVVRGHGTLGLEHRKR